MRAPFVCLLLAGIAPAAGPGPVENSIRWLEGNFKSPPAIFGTAPFLVWNHDTSEQALDLHLDALRRQGVTGVFIHPRYGMTTEYLSPRWFELVRHTVDRAKKSGMVAWLYDENSYPSGFAGGHVPERMPESWNEGQGMRMVQQARLEKDASKRYLAVFRRAGEGFEDIGGRESDYAALPGDYRLIEITFYQREPFSAGWPYVDLIRPGVTGKFIEVTMRGYEKAVGAEFGKAVPGIFTDEPNIAPPRPRDSVRWTPDLFEQFEKRRGYALRPHLVLLWEETGDWRRVRHDYYRTLLELFIERWAKPWYEYTEKAKLAWTGHYWEHGWPNPFHGGDNMAMYAWHHVPGIDMLFNQWGEGVNAQFGNVRAVKELSSAANQMGRRRRLSETYGGAGWELRFEDMKRLGDWQAALGVNLMNQHLSFQSLAGCRKYDYPPSFGEHAPWWKHYKPLADYFARLSLALSAGEQVNHVLVIEPTASAWMYASQPKANRRMMALGEEFQQFLNALERLQIEYDLGSEDIIERWGSVAGGRFAVGRRAYSTVVLAPGTETLYGATAAMLERFTAEGGRVITLVDPPRRVDGAPSPRLAGLGKKWRRVAKAEDLPGEGLPRLQIQERSVAGKLFHQRRKLNEGELLFLANSSLEERSRGTFATAGKSVRRLDPMTGGSAPYPWTASGEGVKVDFAIPPAGSLLLFVSKAAGPDAPAPPDGKTEAELPAPPPAIRRVQPNVLKIDYLDLTLGGERSQGIYFWTAQDRVFKHHGFEQGNPWIQAIQFKRQILDRDRFPAGSGFEAAYHFTVAPGVKTAGMQLVAERPQLWKATVNGRAVTARPGAWWVDRQFGVYEIGDAVKEGANTITLAASPFSVHHELEPVYVLGDFGVRAEPSGWTAVPAGPMKIGAWKDQGLPFYFGEAAYERTAGWKPGRGRAKVRLGRWGGTVAEVKVNGAAAGIVFQQPYEIDVTRLMKPGPNRVEAIVTGSLKNLFGPHHGKINRGIVTPWDHRRGPEKQPPGAAYDLDAYGLLGGFAVVVER
jgi:hypothetical protein